MAQEVNSTAPARLARLDGLRGIAALGVALHHIFFHFAAWPFAGGPMAIIMGWFADWGWTLVDLFFVLSGYVFAHVYLTGDSLSSRENLADFAVARFARLYPLHLFMLLSIAAFTLGEGANTLFAFFANLAMLQAFISPFAESFDQPSWSLSVECLCYAIFALAAFTSRRTLHWVTAIAALWGLAMLLLHGEAGGPWVRDVLPRGLLGFFAGQGIWHFRDRLRAVPSALLAIILVLGLWFQNGNWSPLVPLAVLCWPSALLLALRLPVMGSRAMTWLGDRSYGIYLVNLPLILLAVRWVDRSVISPWATLLWQAALVAVVLFASELSYRLIEVPSRRLIRSLWIARAKAAVHAAA